MPILLPSGHPRADLGALPRDVAERRPVRIGIVNIMPRMEQYEPHLLAPLSRTASVVEPVFIRLTSHDYQSSDHEHLDRFYVPFESVVRGAPLDGLILTGAPVEELPFEEVRYWRELSDILAHARGHIRSTLGICWGGLALGNLVGVDKRLFAKKLFGVFEERVLVDDHDVLRAESGAFVCAQSRHSGAVQEDLEARARDGAIRLLSRGEESGYSMFETSDGRYLAHLGHPEYEADRLLFEWNRDRALGRADVPAPAHFRTSDPETTWRGHRESLFARWVARVTRDLI